MLYWVTRSFPSAVAFYSNVWRDPWRPAHDRMPMMEAPTGVSWFGADRQPAAMQAAGMLYDLRYTSTHEHGGHFAPVEQPEAVIDDIRATFRTIHA